MRLVSWNVNRAGRRVERQVAALMGRKADVIALQEVSENSVLLYRNLMSGEYPYFMDSSPFVTMRGKSVEKKPSYVAIASRGPLEVMETGFSVESAKHKFLSVFARIDGRVLEIHSAHIPPGSQYGQRKARTLRGIYEALAHRCGRPRILCGDFNTPQAELSDGTIVTWAQRKRKNGGWMLNRKRGVEWEEAERSILSGLANYDLADVFRMLHPYTVRDSSWFWKGKVRGKERVIGRRYDHIFASRSLKPIRCEYLNKFRDPMKLSDHSPIEADFQG